MLQQATILGDEFSLTHRNVFNKRDPSIHSGSTWKPDDAHSTHGAVSKLISSWVFCLKPGHLLQASA